MIIVYGGAVSFQIFCSDVFHLLETGRSTGPEGIPRTLGATGVLGAGLMGGSIAQLIADRAGIPVRLKDVAHPPLAKGLAHAANLFVACQLGIR